MTTITATVDTATPITVTINTYQGTSINFLGLTDSPDSYSGEAGKFVNVKSSEDGVEFSTPDHTDLLNIGTNTHAQIDTHISGTGADHTYIDQDVTSGSSPTFDGANITGIDADNVDIADVGGIIIATNVEDALQENRTAIDLNTTHRGQTDNPHSVTLAQVGGTTDHTALSNIGTNTHAQIDTHIANTSNPHSVTLAQAGGTKTMYVVGFDSNCDYVCDGTADDVQIQAAITAAGNAGGGIVYLKEGDYDFSSKVTFGGSNIQVIGEGYGTNLILNDSYTDSQMFQSSGYTHLALMNFRFNGKKGTVSSCEFVEFTSCHFCIIKDIWNPNGLYDNNIELRDCSYCLIRNFEGNGANGDNILLSGTSGSHYCVIADCVSHDTDNANNNLIGVFNLSSHNIVYGNRCYGGASYGINLETTATYNIITDNIIYDCAGGISTLTSTDNIIANNHIESCTSTHPLRLDGDRNYLLGNQVIGGTTTSQVEVQGDECVVDGNVLINSPAHGIFINGGTRAKICNNKVDNPTTDGIYAYNTSKNSINNNEIYDAGEDGINLNVVSSTVMNGNVIDGSTSEGVVTDNTCTDITVNGNSIINGGAEGIRLNSSTTYVTIVGNTIIGNDTHGINLNSANRNTITGNIIHNNNQNTAGTYDGVYSWNGTYNIISGNQIAGHDTGVTLAGSADYNIITNNIMDDNTNANSIAGSNNVNTNNIE